MHGYPHQIMRGKDRSYVVFDWVYLYSLILFVVDRLHIQPYIIYQFSLTLFCPGCMPQVLSLSRTYG